MIAAATRFEVRSAMPFPGTIAGMMPPPPSPSPIRFRRDEKRTEPSKPIVHLVGFDEEDSEALCDLLSRVGVAMAVHEDVEAFIRKAPSELPGCLVVHARLSPIGGLDFVVRFQRPESGLPIIVVADRPDVRMAVFAMKAGVIDFLETPFRDQEMLEAIGTALRIDRVQREAEARRLELRTRFAALTLRERQVMALVTQGLLNKQVAGDLGLSEITVKVHRGSVMRKMCARTLAELVRMADAIAERGEDPHLAAPSVSLRSWR